MNAILGKIEYNNLAITSIGLDGEEIDQVTYLNKPRIYAYEGYLIATASKTLKEFEASYEILEDTDIFTSIGYVKIVKIIKAGNVLIAGPSIISDMEKTVLKLEKYKLKNIFIDGAFFRHSLAKVAEATILVVGASFSRDMDKVVSDAVATVRKFTLKKAPNELIFMGKLNNVSLVNQQDEIIDLKIKSIIGRAAKILNENNKNCKFIYVPRSLSNDFVEALVEERRDYTFDIVVESPVNIQLNMANLNNLFKLKNEIYVLNQINLKAVCYNPTSPHGYEFNNREFVDKLEKSLRMKIFNVVEGSIE